MTASSCTSWSRFSPPSNFVKGHVSIVWFMVCCGPQSQEGDWARPHLCKLAQPVRKWFIRDHVWWERWKPGCQIVGSVTIVCPVKTCVTYSPAVFIGLPTQSLWYPNRLRNYSCSANPTYVKRSRSPFKRNVHLWMQCRNFATRQFYIVVTVRLWMFVGSHVGWGLV